MNAREFRRTIHTLLTTIRRIHNDLQFIVELPTIIEELDVEEFDSLEEKLQSIAKEF